MKRNITLTVTSLLSILLFSFHWADEVARGLEPGTTAAAGGFAIFAVWLSATLAFPNRRLGLALILLGGVFAFAVPILHMTGRGLVLGRYGTGSVMFFWVWTNLALGATGTITVVLAAQEFWNRRATRARS
jgi:hypothetical protein